MKYSFLFVGLLLTAQLHADPLDGKSADFKAGYLAAMHDLVQSCPEDHLAFLELDFPEGVSFALMCASKPIVSAQTQDNQS